MKKSLTKAETKQYFKKVYEVFSRKYAVPFFAVFLALWVFSMHFTFAFNMSDSLPGTMYIISKKVTDLDEFEKGEYIAYRWIGDKNLYANGTVFLKRVGAKPGDTIQRKGREFFNAGKSLGVAKQYSLTGDALEVNQFSGVVPERFFWSQADSPNSLDSRYELSGLIGAGQIIGKGHLVF